ncbi:MAG TPA: sugar phosphate isomerase/epimerase family protein [Blastocatellia bacterium]|nr:sugar phosphate isomerase/epimerase family protein [Blastocatellia bacterium]
MKLALNGATTMNADLETDIAAASAAGFGGIEIWASKLGSFLRERTASDLKRLLNTHSIDACSINSIERSTFRDHGAREALAIECTNLCRIAAQVGCPYIVVVPSPLPPNTERTEVIRESANVLRELANIAGHYGVSLAFEFLGQPNCSVQTLAHAAEIVKVTDRENVGLVIDTFHFYAGGSTIDSLKELDVRRLFIFHLNDAEDFPRNRLEDRHRLLPGLGILPLRDIISGLHSIGYEGIASIEIFRPEYWARDPFELARAAFESGTRVLSNLD